MLEVKPLKLHRLITFYGRNKNHEIMRVVKCFTTLLLVLGRKL